MTGRDQIYPDGQGVSTIDAGLTEKAHLSHIAILRAARVQHQAIARGLQNYFDAVAAEQVPKEFLDILSSTDR